MTKQSNTQIKNKAIAYFIEQKITEIVTIVLGLAAFIFIPYWFGNWIYQCAPSLFRPDISTFGRWALGVGMIMGTTFLLWGAGYLIKMWISYNWDKALKRARSEK